MPPPPLSLVSASSVSCPGNRWSPLLPSRVPNSWVQSVAYPLRLRRSSESPLHPLHAPAVSVACIFCMMTRIHWPASGTHSLLVPTVPLYPSHEHPLLVPSLSGPQFGSQSVRPGQGSAVRSLTVRPVIRSEVGRSTDRSIVFRSVSDLSFDQESVRLGRSISGRPVGQMSVAPS